MTAPHDDPDPRPESLRRLGQDPTMPTMLEDRVVRSLRARGTLRRRSNRIIWPLAAAAAVACFLVGRQTAPPTVIGPSEAPGVKWMLLLYEDAAFQAPEAGHEHAYVQEYRDWALSLRDRHQLLDGAELRPTRLLLEPQGVPVQVSASSPLGHLSGYFIIVAPTLEEARAIAATSPHLKHRGRVAIQPLGAS